MGKEDKQILHQIPPEEAEDAKIEKQNSDFISLDSTEEDSASSSSALTDLMEDATSSSSSSSSSLNGPLCELSELMAQLPIKRGLSKFYEGKSQSFTSLASVKSLEDLPEKENPYNKRMKLFRSYGRGLDGHGHQAHHHHHHHSYSHSHSQNQRFCTPKPNIAKKVSSRGSFLSTMVGRNDLLSTCNRPTVPIQK